MSGSNKQEITVPSGSKGTEGAGRPRAGSAASVKSTHSAHGGGDDGHKIVLPVTHFFKRNGKALFGARTGSRLSKSKGCAAICLSLHC